MHHHNEKEPWDSLSCCTKQHQTPFSDRKHYSSKSSESDLSEKLVTSRTIFKHRWRSIDLSLLSMIVPKGMQIQKGWQSFLITPSNKKLLESILSFCYLGCSLLQVIYSERRKEYRLFQQVPWRHTYFIPWNRAPFWYLLKLFTAYLKP